jgi:hypothetical protein
MYSYDKNLQVYIDLAEMYQLQRDAGMREVFLMLAADSALKAGRPGQAEQLRQELLKQNPYHALKPFPTFVEAAQHPDIESYLNDLRLKYPVEVAEDMLESIIPATLPPPSSTTPGTDPPQPRAPHVPTLPPQPTPAPTANDPEKPLKVYRESYELDETQPPPTLPPQPRQPKPVGQPKPPLPRPPARAAQPGRVPPPPAGRPRPVPPRPAPLPMTETAAKPKPEPEEEQPTNGAWVGTLLYLIVLAAGVALAMYTLVPHELLQD